MAEHESRVLRATLKGGQARIFLCDTTRMAEEARNIHNASNTCTVAMGRMISATAMLGINLKDANEKMTAIINGKGPGGSLCAVASSEGRVKVTIDHPEVEMPLNSRGHFDIGGLLGKDGQLTVIRSYGFGEPYVGQVNLVSGEVAEDFAMYYLESEQTPSLCALGTSVREHVESSGGILIQAMPGCSEEVLSALEVRAELFSSIARLLQDMSLEEILEACFRGLDPEILEIQPLALECDCSQERIEEVILSMGADEIRDIMQKEHHCQVVCHFCRKAYDFNEQELEALIQRASLKER